MDAATALAAALGAASDAVQTERARADADIATAVDRLNGDLARIAELNGDICAATIAGSDAGSLVDERQRLIDRVSKLVPVREVARDHGRVALLSEGGLLLDGAPPVLGFQAATSVGAGSSLSGGGLSGITLNGQACAMTRARSVLAGGRLDGLFAVRDDLAPQVQGDLDALAALFAGVSAPAASTITQENGTAVIGGGAPPATVNDEQLKSLSEKTITVRNGYTN